MKKLVALTLLLTLMAMPVWATELYTVDEASDPDTPSNYEMVDGTPATADYFNQRWEDIDGRIHILETYGSDIFKVFSCPSGTDPTAGTSTDTITFDAGSNMAITGNATTNTITFDATATPINLLGEGVEVLASMTDIDFDANFAVTDEGSNEGGIALASAITGIYSVSLTGYLSFDEVAEPPDPAADDGTIYVADNTGTTTPYFKDSAGTVTNLLTGASDEAIQDLVGAMFSGNTEILGSLDYQDADGTIDLTVEGDLHLFSWSNVVDADITNTLTASIFVGSGSSTNAVDLATAEVSGTLPVGSIADQYLRNDIADTTVGNLTLNTVAPGDSPSLIFNDGGSKTLSIAKADTGNATFINNEAALVFKAHNDLDDYVKISTTNNIPRITFVGANGQIYADSGTVDFGSTNIYTLGTITGSWTPVLDDDFYIDDGVGDSPKANWRDADDKDLVIYKTDAGAAILLNTETDNGGIRLYPDNNTTKYFVFRSTAAGEPTITAAGGTEIGFGGENLTTTGTLAAGVTTITGVINTSVGLDAVGAVGMGYGSGDVTDHAFTTDGTGDSEIVLPNDSIGPAEMDSTTGAYDFGGTTSFEIPNSADVSANITEGMLSWDSDDDILYIGDGTNPISIGGAVETVSELVVNYTAPATASSLFGAIDIELNVGSLAATSEAHGIDIAAVGATSGKIVGMGTHVGVSPIHQHIGTFSTPSQTEYAGEIPSGGSWSDGIDGNTIFEADNDEIYIGSAAVFSELEVILSTPCSKDEIVICEFYDTSPVWVAFTPIDGTQGFQQDGDIEWNADDLTSWNSAGDPAGVDGSSGYWIRIRRTRNGGATDPIVTTIKTLAPTEYEWDESGNVKVNSLIANSFDGDGAVDLDYGSADITDHTFTTDGTGDSEIVLPDDSIGDSEIDWNGLVTSHAFTVTGAIYTNTGFDATGDSPLWMGSADVDKFTFTTDGTGDGEIVLPNDSIGPAEIVADAIEEQHLKAVNAAVDEYTLTYEATTGDFEWEASAGGGNDYIPFEMRLGIPTTNLDDVDTRQGIDTTNWHAYVNRTGLTGAANDASQMYIPVQLPSDFSAFYTDTNIWVQVYSSDRANNTITLSVYDDTGDVDDGVNGADIEPGSDATWTEASDRITETDANYAAGDWIYIMVEVNLDAADYYYIGDGYIRYVKSL